MKKHSGAFVSLLIFGVSVLCPAQTSAKSVTVAVFDFVNADGQISELGRYFTEETINHFVQDTRYRVVERGQISTIKKELELNASGYISDESAIGIGELLGAQVIVTGTLIKNGRKVAVHTKITQTSTGVIVSTGSVQITEPVFVKMYDKLIPDKSANEKIANDRGITGKD